MRSRSAIAVVSLATAFSASVIPAAAQAADRAASVASDATFSQVVVNGGKDVVLGPTTKKTVTMTWREKDPDGIAASWAYLWHGPNTDDADGYLPTYAPAGSCTLSPDRTVATCKLSFVVDAKRDFRRNALAGTWNVLGAVQDATDDWTEIDSIATARFKRAATVTVNAAPEPVKKGKTITVTGKLARANWEDGKYHGYTGQSVKLQFRKKGSSTYTTVKTIKTNSTGNLKTTVKASQDGYFRFVFSGTGTTGPSTAAGDFVDVR